MELQQSPQYARYIEALNWKVLKLDGVQMFYKKIPFLGGILKIQRPQKLPNVTRLIELIAEYKIKTVAIEPIEGQNLNDYKKWVVAISPRVKIVRSVYMPTKTILVDLKPQEEQIFKRFTEAKRRAVRRAKKNGIVIKETANIKDLINIKNKSGGLFGFITTVGIDKFWSIMAPAYTSIVLAYHKDHVVGGILIIYWNKTAFYWIAGATRRGKKLFAPTLLVWEALKIAKKHGAKNFDFVGVWDERMPSEHLDWKGFTHFKEGFGGSALYYPVY